VTGVNLKPNMQMTRERGAARTRENNEKKYTTWNSGFMYDSPVSSKTVLESPIVLFVIASRLASV
jgi:hypothetical protein